MAPGEVEVELVLQEVDHSVKVQRVEKAHDYSHYVAIYDKQVRTIKWWVQQGRAAVGGPDLPPLDKPAEMPLWWKRVMKQRCPESVENAARAACAAAAPLPSEESKPSTTSSPPLGPRLENPVVTSQEQNLQHLKEQLARARREQLEAENEEPPNFATIETKQRKWRELRVEVDRAEEAVFKLRSKQGKLVDLEQLGAQLLPMLVTTVCAIRSLFARLKPQLDAAASEEEKDRIWQAGLDDSFSELIAAGFVAREHLALAA